jgi:hypothetical protein
MKINELNEGPLDFAKKIGAGLKGFDQGGFAGAGAGWAAQGAANKQQDMIKAVSKQALQQWAEYNQNVKTSTGQDATGEQAEQWLSQFMGGGKPTTPAPTNAQPAALNQWLQKEVAAYMAKKAMPAAGAPQGETPNPKPQAGGQTPPTAEVAFPPDLSGYTKEQLTQLKQIVQQSLKAA